MAAESERGSLAACLELHDHRTFGVVHFCIHVVAEDKRFCQRALERGLVAEALFDPPIARRGGAVSDRAETIVRVSYMGQLRKGSDFRVGLNA